MAEVIISFCAAGTIKQRIQITKKGLSADKLVKMLNQGKAVTTIHDDEGSMVEMTATGEKLATILDTENNLEYSEFDVD